MIVARPVDQPAELDTPSVAATDDPVIQVRDKYYLQTFCVKVDGWDK
jgi:hypothetical protein